MHWGQCRYWRD